MNPSLWELPALDAVADMQAMRLTVTEYLEAHLARLEATEPLVQAWAFLDIEGARARAPSISRNAQAWTNGSVASRRARWASRYSVTVRRIACMSATASSAGSSQRLGFIGPPPGSMRAPGSTARGH